MRYFVTGSAGFIGYHVCRRLLGEGASVVGFDAITPYYDVRLKQRRHSMLAEYPHFRCIVGALEDAECLADAMDQAQPGVVIHLAAQAGVRYSNENPRAYIDSNIVGTFNLLESAARHEVAHLLLASTSSIYGANTDLPFREIDRADHQVSIYAATKKATESLSHAWSHLHSLPTTVFRFFTVYGPWGRPDMALFLFTSAILRDEPIDLFNFGDMRRDFTYIDDIVEGIVRLSEHPPQLGRPVAGDSLSPVAPWRVVNIGNGSPQTLADFVSAIEAATGKTAIRNLRPMQPGDVPATWANSDLLDGLVGAFPRTPLNEGVAAFVRWYRDEYTGLG